MSARLLYRDLTRALTAIRSYGVAISALGSCYFATVMSLIKILFLTWAAVVELDLPAWIVWRGPLERGSGNG